jgi:NADPH-dependent curcumin reductase CurA
MLVVRIGHPFGLEGSGRTRIPSVRAAAAGPGRVLGWAGVAGETSERGLRLLDVNAGDTLFVDGGAGGVGAVAVQMALARGAKVIASASEANHDYLRELGAPRCCMARAWPSGSGPLPAGRSTRSLMSRARPRSRS